MSSTRKVADAIGRKRLQAELGVGRTALANAITEGKFPAPWIVVTQRLASEIGIKCPDDLFNVKLMPVTNGDSAAERQEADA